MTRESTEDCETKSGILTFAYKGNPESIHVNYDPVEKCLIEMNNLVSVNCGNLTIIGGMKNNLYHIFEFELKECKQMSCLNFKGTFSSIVHFSSNSPPQEDILIAVGYSSYYDLIFGTDGSNCIEYLVMNALFRSNPWRVCKDKMPSTVSDYQVNIYENKLILTGGYNCDDREYSNQVLEGSITFEKSELRVSWTLLKPMHEKRFNHVAAVIGDCLYCLGGEEDEDKDDLKSTEYYSFKSKEWKRGLNLQCCLSQAKGVVDQALKLCFIIGGVRDGVRSPQVSLFNPFEGLLDIKGNIDITSYNEITAVLL